VIFASDDSSVKNFITGNSKFSVNGENLPVITGKFWKINKNQYIPGDGNI
jgi:hypothetical protein